MTKYVAFGLMDKATGAFFKIPLMAQNVRRTHVQPRTAQKCSSMAVTLVEPKLCGFKKKITTRSHAVDTQETVYSGDGTTVHWF